MTFLKTLLKKKYFKSLQIYRQPSTTISLSDESQKIVRVTNWQNDGLKNQIY